MWLFHQKDFGGSQKWEKGRGSQAIPQSSFLLVALPPRGHSHYPHALKKKEKKGKKKRKRERGKQINWMQRSIIYAFYFFFFSLLFFAFICFLLLLLPSCCCFLFFYYYLPVIFSCLSFLLPLFCSPSAFLQFFLPSSPLPFLPLTFLFLSFLFPSPTPPHFLLRFSQLIQQ